MSRLGSKGNPIVVNVHDPAEIRRIYMLCGVNGWHVVIGTNKEEPISLHELNRKLNPPTLEYEGYKLGRNESCPCGSGKKYKKCHVDRDIELPG